MIRRCLTISILMLSLVALAFPQSKDTTKKATRAKEDRSFADTKMLQAKVAQITASKLVVENEYGAKREINLDSNTKFSVANKKNVKATDVAPGLIVNVTFREADNTAIMVQEKEKPKEKK